MSSDSRLSLSGGRSGNSHHVKPEATPPGQPIAIVGMACRFPKAPDLSAFWRLLDGGENAVTEGVPGSGIGRVGELFPDSDVQSLACRFGAYLDDLDLFDASFFRISPVEATFLDPQQRLMLETSWRALEDAGIDPDRLKGTRTGVYAGISNNEYRGLILDVSDTAEPAASLYTVTGTSFNTAIGRVAYVLGLEGPAMALDTACSSSLVAMHQAVTGLQRGEADLALAGGVHTILSGRLLELRANAGMLSPDGRCATFDAAANGYVRGEGCGIVALKRLEDAEADGDRIWGVILSTAVNQDGASPGLTVPNGPSQERVIEDALRLAGIGPTGVDYVEAHGTGTEVGDPIEANATAEVYGRGRDANHPLLIGSVKTNIGHLESAAGVAGVIKVILSMNQGTIPRHLHFQTPNPEMDWDRMRLEVTSEPTPWPDHPDRPVRAGVSGFGWSGTNAHVVLEGYRPSRDMAADSTDKGWPAGPPRAISLSKRDGDSEETVTEVPGDRPIRMLPLSGKSGDTLRELAEGYVAWLDEQATGLAATESAADPLLSDMAWTASVGRSHFPNRSAVVFRDARSLREGLEAVAESCATDGANPVVEAPTQVAFAYTGQASQWAGMGKILYDSEPVFRNVLDRCDRIISADRGFSLLDVMLGLDASAGDLDDPKWTQPAIYALECALTALWSSLGIRPTVVLGHSLGEIAAAQATGIFSLEDGLRFAATRGELVSALPEKGAMAAVFSEAARISEVVDELNSGTDGPGLCIAADNGTQQVVSGPESKVASIMEHFEKEEVRVLRLRNSPAYHSDLIEPAMDPLAASLSDVEVAAPSGTFVSTLTGGVLDTDMRLDGSYWRRQMRNPVQFRAAVQTLAELGVEAVVEIGPHAVLGPMISLNWPESPETTGPPPTLASLRRPSRDIPAEVTDAAFVSAVAGAYEAGLPVRFEGLFSGEKRRRIVLPGYPFQRERYWVDTSRQRRPAGPAAGLPLLGVRHESARGEITFETDLYPTDPGWMQDHRVFGQLLAPGALLGAMAVTAGRNEGTGHVLVEDMQLLNPLLFVGEEDEDPGAAGRKVQLLVDPNEGPSPRRVQILSQGESGGEWTLHAECRMSLSAQDPEEVPPLDLEGLKTNLSAVAVPSFYRAKAAAGIELGPSFRTLKTVWSRDGEALGEISLPEAIDPEGLFVHPLLLDGCFQVMSAANRLSDPQEGTTYLPFGWERMWFTSRMRDNLICHFRLRKDSRGTVPENGTEDSPEVLTGDLFFYDASGSPVGGIRGYTIKKATRAALLSAVEGVEDLLYEVVWRDRLLPPGMPPADFLTAPSAIAERSNPFTAYLAAEGVEAVARTALLDDLELLARSYAVFTLDRLGWNRESGDRVEPEALRQRLKVGDEHRRLFRRMLEMLAFAGILEEDGGEFVVRVGSADRLPDEVSPDPDSAAVELGDRHAHGSNETGLFRRSGGALADVLLGKMDPLTLLFSSGEPSAADLYRKAPVARAANSMLADAVAALLSGIPQGRRLRILEIGAGTGSATASVLPELPPGGYDYTYTDISAGFFSEAEDRFGGSDAAIEYRVLDIEKDPVEQGYDAHGYDLLIASNVLHATRYLDVTLNHCRRLLAPSGQLLALENLRGQGWLDLTFGQLDGWWRFADDYRPHHALAGPAVWRQALGDAGFVDAAVLGVSKSESGEQPDRGVILAQGPPAVDEPPGTWILAADQGGTGEELAQELASHNQTVILVREGSDVVVPPAESGAGVIETALDMGQREAWKSLLDGLASGPPIKGVVHLASLVGHGAQSTTEQLAQDTKRSTGSALALVQGVLDGDLTPETGSWFITRGAQVLEKERGGELTGATLWGIGKVMARETPHLQARMIDLDPGPEAPIDELVNELMYPDSETHIAYRLGVRQAARLVRAGDVPERISLADESGWLVEPDPGGALEGLQADPIPDRSLEPNEVRVAVEAAGLNFWDVFRAINVIDEGLLGGEACGRVMDVGTEVSTVSPGDRVVCLGFGTFGSDVVTPEAMVVPAPEGIPAASLATIPTAFVSAELSYQASGLNPGDRVLIHAGAGGVGLAAIQLAQAGGAEVYATASAPKQDYLRSIGVTHVFDSRQTAFGQQIMDATNGEGVAVVLNSLTGPGFIDASLSCLAQGGRFVELSRMDILSEEEMAATRPDVSYTILKLDELKESYPAEAGDALRIVMKRFAADEIGPIIHSRWSLTETGPAIKYMRAARHVGKIVLAGSPFERRRLREDRTYLVTGGMGGIGCALAEWLANHGAGTIVLNGRRNPDPETEDAIAALRNRGFTVEVEIADVTDTDAVDAMLERMGRNLPPLAGIIHSVGALSDSALGNQNWERFETVLWPKMLGAWHLHRATVDVDLDLFVLFSSIVGTLGNAGQANHAAANAFLDQLAAHRRAMGLPGQSIAWGAWSGFGEAEEQRERISRQRESFGGGWFTPQQGFKAFERLLRQDTTTSAVMAVDWQMFGEAMEHPPPLLEDLLAVESETDVNEAGSDEDLLTQLQKTPVSEREQLLVSFLQREVQAVLRLPTLPASSVGFFDLGMDSLMAVELRNRLNRSFLDLYTAPNTLVFDFPDISVLARHLVGELDVAEGDTSPGTQAAPPDRQEPDRQDRIEAAEVVPEPRRIVADLPADGRPSVPPPDPQPSSGQRPAQQPRVNPESTPSHVAAAVEDGVAIVGMACRFPGASDIATYWDQLEAGADAVQDHRPGSGDGSSFPGEKDSVEEVWRRGGYIDDIDRFDARFFRITPIEARGMDPQQRLLLETSWHALDDAGIDPDSLRGSRTGVFAGISASEYRDLMKSGKDGMSYLGTARSMAVSRISFLLGLEGPTMPVELNCASALVAVHQAVASLDQDEVDMALAGGVNVILSPAVTMEMAYLGMLSTQGRCGTFDASADGFVRGEGCGVLVLKRLREAEADGDRIWGVIRGTAVNQNGASAGPTVPNGPAQERVIKTALSRAGIAPNEVDYLEAHGAGSQLGDPIEVQAAAAVYGQGRESDCPLLIGSVKTNIGHLEAAAGVAGLVKVVMAMNRKKIPKQLHFTNPNPNLDWDRLPVRVASEQVDWPRHPDRPPRAAVSAFSVSGANAHVVVEGYETGDDGAHSVETVTGVAEVTGARQAVPVKLPAGVPDVQLDNLRPGTRSNRLLPLSGKNPAALGELAGNYLSWLDRCLATGSNGEPEEEFLADMAWTASVGRSHFNCRSGVVFRDIVSLRAGLAELASSDLRSETVETNWINVAAAARKVAFLYDGWDGRWPDIVRDLYDSEPVVRGVLDHCEALFRDETDTSLLDPLFDGEGKEKPENDPAWTDPAAYAFQCAVTALWSSLDVRPAVVCGRDVGEIAAAWTAGAFTLDEGLRIALARGKTVGATDENRAAGVAVEETMARLDGINVSTPSLAMVSGATGNRIGVKEVLDFDRWRTRAGVGPASGVSASTLADLAVDTLIEIGPGSEFAPRLTEAWPEMPADEGAAGPALFGNLSHSSGESDRNGADRFLQAVKTAYDIGLPVSPEGLFAGESRRRRCLPGYPFQRMSFWIG